MDLAVFVVAGLFLPAWPWSVLLGGSVRVLLTLIDPVERIEIEDWWYRSKGAAIYLYGRRLLLAIVIAAVAMSLANWARSVLA